MIPFRSSYPEPFHPNSTRVSFDIMPLHTLQCKLSCSMGYLQIHTHIATSHQKLIYNKENWRHTNTNGNEKILAEHESQISIKIIAVAEP